MRSAQPNASATYGWNVSDCLHRSMVDHLIGVISLAIAASKARRAEWCSPVGLIAKEFFSPSVWRYPADRHGSCLNNHANRYHQQRKAGARGVDVCLEPGFFGHSVSVASTSLRRPTHGRLGRRSPKLAAVFLRTEVFQMVRSNTVHTPKGALQRTYN